MATYYSKTTNGFYDDSLINVSLMPSDKVEITYQQWKTLLDNQDSGQIITADENGYPINAARPPATAGDIRSKRDALIAATDWTQCADIPQATKDKWATYRQALRDVPQQNTFPTSVTWPVAPT